MKMPVSSTEVHMMTLACNNKECLTRIRVGRFLRLPTTRVGALSFCPLCGGDAFVHTDNDETYWETLARAYELPVEAVVAIYGIWNPNEYPKLSDFVTVMKQEAKLVK